MTIKPFFKKVHLYLGIASGLLVFCVCISGFTYSFRPEMFDAIHAELVFTDTTTTETKPLAKLWQKAQQYLGENRPITYIKSYSSERYNIEFRARKKNKHKISYSEWLVYDVSVFINPFTGRVVGVLDNKYEFFQLTQRFHRGLLLNPRYGKQIVGLTILTFIATLLSGLYLWWPARKRKHGYRFKVKRQKKIGLIYNIHKVIGVYALPFNLLMGVTGLVWTYKWLEIVWYLFFGIQTIPNMPSIPPPYFISQDSLLMRYESIQKEVTNNYPSAYAFRISTIPPNSSKPIKVRIIHDREYSYTKSHLYYNHNATLISQTHYQDKNVTEKIRALNYDIHTGAIGGILGRILIALAALIGASMPITGFILWRNRVSKQRKNSNT